MLPTSLSNVGLLFIHDGTTPKYDEWKKITVTSKCNKKFSSILFTEVFRRVSFTSNKNIINFIFYA